MSSQQSTSPALVFTQTCSNQSLALSRTSLSSSSSNLILTVAGPSCTAPDPIFTVATSTVSPALIVSSSSSTSQPPARKGNSARDVKDTEISLLKQELIIVKTKFLQVEADNKDLERKNKILSDSIKIYQGGQCGSTNRCSEGPSGYSPPSLSIPVLPAAPDSLLSNNTLNRLINYFLNIVEQTKPEYSARAPQPSTCVPASTPTECSIATVISPPANTPCVPPLAANVSETLSPGPVQQVEHTGDVSEQVLIENCSMDTIDEFTDNILYNDTRNSELQHLNFQIPTIQ